MPRPAVAVFRGECMFEQSFKSIDDILHKDAGCTSELDCTEQSSWLSFLKCLAAPEVDKVGRISVYLVTP